MTTDNFQIVLQKGITGGFAPPTPTALYTLSRSENGEVLVINGRTRPHGTPALGSATVKEIKLGDHASDIAALRSILRNIPPQYPGKQDLYGRNISIVEVPDTASFASAQYGAMAGGIPAAEPTEEQKARFDEAVAIVDKLVALSFRTED